MTANRLSELLEETSAGIAPPSLAEASWTKAAWVRRKRRVTAAVVSAVAVMAVVLVIPIGRGTPKPAPMPVAPLIVAPHVDGVPKVLVPRKIDPLPQVWRIPEDPPVLSAHPVDRAVAVAQEHDWEAEGSPMLPLHVLDPAGQWIRVDVGKLIRTHDSGGNEADPLRVASLSPDGRRVAVPQPQAVVVIDLTTAGVHRIAVSGLMEQVLWLSGDTLLAEGEGAGVVRIGWRTGAVTKEVAGLSVWNAAGPGAGGEIAELVAPDGRRALRVWTAGAAEMVRESPVGDEGLPEGFHISEWYGVAVPNGAGLIVAGAWGDRPGYQGGAEMLTVIDTADGSVRRVLDLGVVGERVKNCCIPVAWVDDETVLAQTDLEGLITWNIRTGVVQLITAGPIPAGLSVRLR